MRAASNRAGVRFSISASARPWIHRLPEVSAASRFCSVRDTRKSASTEPHESRLRRIFVRATEIAPDLIPRGRRENETCERRSIILTETTEDSAPPVHEGPDVDRTGGAGWRRGDVLRARRPAHFPPRVVAQAEEIPVGAAQRYSPIPPMSEPCILLRPASDTYVAYSRLCTHASCPVFYQAEENRLDCPCHGGSFSVADGVGAGRASPASFAANFDREARLRSCRHRHRGLLNEFCNEPRR